MLRVLWLKRRWCRLSAAMMIWIAVFLTAHGCATGQGRVNRSLDITRAFESYQVFPNHTYYYKGQPTRPFAIVALQPDYQIHSRFWNVFDPDPQELKRLVDALYEDRDDVYPYGAYLLDAKGRRVGLWYSSLRTVGVTVDSTQRLVSITTDQPWVRDDRKAFRRFEFYLEDF